MILATLAASLDALAAEAPGPVDRGRRALARVLDWTGTTRWPEVAASFSDLAGGFPVELVWRPGRPGLFWTAEPAAPELPRAQRLERTLALLDDFGALPGAAVRATLEDALASSRAEWPLWLSGRHDDTGDSWKLYARVGDKVAGFDAVAGRIGLVARPTMLGIGSASEYYWTLDRGGLTGLVTPLARQLDRLVRDWGQGGLTDATGRTRGISARLAPDGVIEALAAFVRIGRSDVGAPLRARLLAAGGARNPALASLWAAGRIRPQVLTLAVTAAGPVTALGFRPDD